MSANQYTCRTSRMYSSATHVQTVLPGRCCSPLHRQPNLFKAGHGRCYSPRHKMPLYSRNIGFERRWMSWQGNSSSSLPLGGEVGEVSRRLDVGAPHDVGVQAQTHEGEGEHENDKVGVRAHLAVLRRGPGGSQIRSRYISCCIVRLAMTMDRRQRTTLTTSQSGAQLQKHSVKRVE
jgi:hypothetical protein